MAFKSTSRVWAEVKRKEPKGKTDRPGAGRARWARRVLQKGRGVGLLQGFSPARRQPVAQGRGPGRGRGRNGGLSRAGAWRWGIWAEMRGLGLAGFAGQRGSRC